MYKGLRKIYNNSVVGISSIYRSVFIKYITFYNLNTRQFILL